MDFLADVAGLLHEEGLDGGVPILEALVEDKAAVGAALREITEQSDELCGFASAEYRDARQAPDVGDGRLNIESKKLAVSNDVVASTEPLHGGVDALAFVPQGRAHVVASGRW